MFYMLHPVYKTQDVLFGPGHASIAASDPIGSDRRSQYYMARWMPRWTDASLVATDRRCTEKVDVYSLGVVLWEIVTHEMPQRGAIRDVLVGHTWRC